MPCARPVATLRGGPWTRVQGRLGEVEAYVDHDAVMDSWERVEVGMALLAQTHNLLRHLDVGEQGRRPRFANHLEPADVASSVRRGVERIGGWGRQQPSAAWRPPPRSSPSWLPRPRVGWSLVQRCRWRWPASPCRRSAGGWPAWTTRRRIMTDLDWWSDAFA